MLFHFLLVHGIMMIMVMMMCKTVHAGSDSTATTANKPNDTCFNAKLPMYANEAAFTKAVGGAQAQGTMTKRDKKKDKKKKEPAKEEDTTTCAQQLTAWMESIGTTKGFELSVFNVGGGPMQVFGQQVLSAKSAKGLVLDTKGYLIWRQMGTCSMTRLEKMSGGGSDSDSNSIFIKDNQKLTAGFDRNDPQLKNCQVVPVDSTLCDTFPLTSQQEAYVYGKWLANMTPCQTTKTK